MLRMSVEMAGVVGFRVLLSHDEELEAIRHRQSVERMATFKKGTIELAQKANPFDLGKYFPKTAAYSAPLDLDEYDKFVLSQYPGLSLKEATRAYERAADEKRHAEFLADLANNPPQGTLEEFNTRSWEEQQALWDEFHRRDRMGTADEMYFYRVLMDQHLKGYIGD